MISGLLIFPEIESVKNRLKLNFLDFSHVSSYSDFPIFIFDHFHVLFFQDSLSSMGLMRYDNFWHSKFNTFVISSLKILI